MLSVKQSVNGPDCVPGFVSVTWSVIHTDVLLRVRQPNLGVSQIQDRDCNHVIVTNVGTSDVNYFALFAMNRLRSPIVPSLR